MTHKTTITTEGGPSLFGGLNPQETPDTWQGMTPAEGTPDEWEEIKQLVEETRQDAERAGVWLLLPPETLLRRGEIYYNQRVDQIRDTMAASGATPDVVAAVCRDYAGILSGSCRFTATAVQMQQALRALKPYEAFNIDRYGLYFALLLNYSRFLLRYYDYDEAVKGLFATEESKRAYISAFYPAMDARAVRWLLNIGYFQPSDFSGFDPAEMGEFFARIADFAAFGEYTLYYTVARLALVATPQELAEVEPPPGVSIAQTSLPKFCEQVVQETADNLNRAGEKFAEAIRSDTHAEQEQARQAGKDWHDDTNAQPVKIHENYGIVLSRPVKVSPHGAEIVNTLPIQQYIDDFNLNPQRYTNLVINATVTQMTVQKVFEGVNLLPSYLSGSMTRIEGGRFGFRTNISQFAEICGYADANNEEKRALLGGLILLSNLYFVVDKPKRYEEFTTIKGRKVKRMAGGRVALKFLTVPAIGLDILVMDK